MQMKLKRVICTAGDSPRGGSPVESPRFADQVYKGPFNSEDIKSLWQETQA